MTTDDRIHTFLDTCTRARNATGERAQAIGRLVVRRADQLREQRHTLLDKLENGWDFLEHHPGRADYALLEDRWITWLHTYERIENALIAGREVWLGAA